MPPTAANPISPDRPRTTTRREMPAICGLGLGVGGKGGGGGDGGGGGQGVGGGGPADDAVGAGTGGKLKVIAEFTQEGGQKFMGEDIQILVAEWDNGQQGRLLFPLDPAVWQNVFKKGTKIATPIFNVSTQQVVIYAQARVRLASTMLSFQNLSGHFVFSTPGTDTLSAKFDTDIQKIDKTVTAPTADAAKGIAAPSPKQYANFELKAQPIGNQQFHVTGKYYTGGISSPDGKPPI